MEEDCPNCGKPVTCPREHGREMKCSNCGEKLETETKLVPKGDYEEFRFNFGLEGDDLMEETLDFAHSIGDELGERVEEGELPHWTGKTIYLHLINHIPCSMGLPTATVLGILEEVRYLRFPQVFTEMADMVDEENWGDRQKKGSGRIYG